MGKFNPAHTSSTQRRTSGSKQTPRRGLTYTLVIGIIVALCTVCGGVYYIFVDDPNNASVSENDEFHKVESKPFEYFVLERGDVQSTNNVEIRCHVKGKGGTQIIKIVDEGKKVKEGDFLVEFDSSALEELLTSAEIVVGNGEASLIQAKSDLRTAQAAFEEYTGFAPTEEILKKARLTGLTEHGDGTFRQELAEIGKEIFIAEENLRRAMEYFLYSQRMARKGYVTQVQLDADRFAVDKSKKELEVANSKFDVLKNFTYKKMVGQLIADIAKQEANVKSATNFYKLNVKQRDEIVDQIKKCTVLAPSAGQVVYNNKKDRHGREEFTVDVNVVIHYNQVVIRLPDPNRMEVKTMVQETRVNSVVKGSDCQIELDSMPGRQFKGKVRRIDAFPVSSYSDSGPKKYATYIDITETVPTIRAGQRAQARIFVHREDDVLQVPEQSVVIKNQVPYCIVRSGDDLKARAVTLGQHNEKFVIIREGLQEGDLVSMAPRMLIDREELPLEKPKTASSSVQKTKKPPETAQKPVVSSASSGGGG